jgi:vanillate O-demethylase ferredoxin subunit
MRYSTTWMDAQVTAVTDAARRVRLIEITPAALYPFTPGAHVDVQVYIDGKPHIRSYSLVGTSGHGKPYTIGVKRLDDSRGGSDYMWSLAPGAKLSVSQPKNQFEMTYGRDAYLLIAGGIGITPIVGMAEDLVRRKANFRLRFAGSSRAEMPFVDRLSELLGDRLSLHISDEGTRLDIPRAIRGMAHGTQVYVCGPMRMLDDVRQTWHDLHLPEGDLRYETFATTGRYPAQAFDVTLPRFGRTITVARNQTLLDALNSNGIEVMSDCERGECGLCMVQILACSGTVDHRDVFLSDEQKAENTKLCACISRVVDGDIVIDTAYRGERSLPVPDFSTAS